MKKVFLGGTCNDSKWRNELIPMLTIDYFNPVVEDWTEACYNEELRQRAECDYVLYVITPKMAGFYSIAEVVDDSNKRPEKTIFAFFMGDNMEYFDKKQLKSLHAVKDLIEINGAISFLSLDEIASYLNGK